jgi:S1-C subfamily serine protease
VSGWELDPEDDGFPRAPLPPHERTWRHPSELSPATMPVGRPFGRTTLIGTGVVGVVLVFGLVQLLLPRSGGSGVATEATQAADRRQAPASTVPATATLRQTTDLASTSAVPATPEPTTPPTTAERPAQLEAVSTVMLLAQSSRAAVPIGDGRRAITTAGSLREEDAIDVRLGDGSAVLAVVVSVDSAANVAVLALTAPAHGAPPDVAATSPQSGDMVYVGCSSPDDGVVEHTDAGIVIEMASAPDEGAPVMDRDGALLGLATTDADGVVHLVPVSAEFVDATTGDRVQVIDVWLGVAFAADTLVVDGVQPDSPAAVAGLQPGDRIAAVGNLPLETIDDLWRRLALFAPGDMTSLRIEREGHVFDVVVTLAARPS